MTIVEDQIRAELNANVRDAPTLFYPCWTVALPLDNVYPGSVYYIEVLIWADTGQVISCKTMGYGGAYLHNSSSASESPELSLTTNPTAGNTDAYQGRPQFTCTFNRCHSHNHCCSSLGCDSRNLIVYKKMQIAIVHSSSVLSLNAKSFVTRIRKNA